MVRQRPRGEINQAVDSKTYRCPKAHSLPGTSAEEMPSQTRATHQRKSIRTVHSIYNRMTASGDRDWRPVLANIPLNARDSANPAMVFCIQPEYQGAVKSPLDCNSKRKSVHAHPRWSKYFGLHCLNAATEIATAHQAAHHQCGGAHSIARSAPSNMARISAYHGC